MKYLAPEYEALLMMAQDVITTSGGDEDIKTPDMEL